ncbi:hypothetical protein CEXT_723561 [Caerostris extrusa]|uniref:Uncharacterized protein n=1 Tax=Caerostris extrusa TaxID=172846 RepID=A0AAV4M440_CAEEX|nr:hypothetical protein CEXT_723561 [Caerostris extrusa]
MSQRFCETKMKCVFSKLCHARGEKEDVQGSLALLTPSGMQGNSLSVRTQGQYKTEKVIGREGQCFRTQERFAVFLFNNMPMKPLL